MTLVKAASLDSLKQEVFSSVSAKLEEGWCRILTKYRYDFKSILNKRGYSIQLIEDGTTVSLQGCLKAITAAEGLLHELFDATTNKRKNDKLQSKYPTELTQSNQRNALESHEFTELNSSSNKASSNENSESCIHIELFSHVEETSLHDQYCTISLQEAVESKNAQKTQTEQLVKPSVSEPLIPESSALHHQQLLREQSCLSHSSAEVPQTGNQDSSRREDVAERETELDCSMCPYKTSQKNLLKRHMKTHFNEELKLFTQLFSCSKCAYKTTRKFHYMRHIRAVHNDLKPYLCDHCGKTFKRQDNLKQHRLMHASSESYTPNPAPFQCQVCKKLCHSKAHLKEHQAVHSTARSFLCEICGASFKTLSVQRKHVNTLHQNPRSFACHICNKRFNTNYALRRHMKQHPFEIEGLDTENSDLYENQLEKLGSDDEQSVDGA